MKKSKIAFLINPASGTGRTRKQAAGLIEFLRENPQYELIETNTAESLLEAGKDLAKQNYQAVFACGGDGTLNLVSKALQSSETAMGIIGLGSGNGYARHSGIPLHWANALKVIENHREKKVDTGLINSIHFLNIAGIGFAAKISHAFKGEVRRGLQGYARTVLKNLSMDPFSLKISNSNGMWEGESWMLDFCNGSQWGNNFRLEPGARDDDGTLNAVIFKKINPVKIPVLGFRFANNSVPQSRDIYSFSGDHFFAEFTGRLPLHVDGEPVAFVENSVEVSVVPSNLIVWTPA